MIFQILLFLLAAVPCGIPYRYNPNPVFPSELAAFGISVLLALAASTLPARDRRISLPWSALIWIALAAVICIQCLAMPVPYWSERTVPVLYFIAAALSVWGFARAREALGIQPLAMALAWGLLVGALFNSAVSVPQVISLIQDGPRLIFGHIGQKNMYGHYLAWGLAAACWLAAERKLPYWLLGVLGTWLSLSLAWSGSRSPFLYAGAWIVFGGVLMAAGRDAVRRLGLLLALAGGLILAMQFIAPLINDLLQHALHAKHEVPTGLDRLDSNGSRRLVEWHKAWITFLDHPWLGVGWGAYAAQSILYQVRPEFAVVAESVLFTHAHNSLLNLMAEAGMVGTAVVGVGLAWVAAGLWQRRNDSVAMLAVALVGVSLLHSLVEYPLWYAHFFLPFALMLYMARDDVTRWSLPALPARIGLGIASIALLVIGVFGGHYYLKLYPILESSKDAGQNAANIRVLQRLRSNVLVDYYADFALSNYITPSRQDIEWKLDILDRLNQVRPYPGQLADAAVMHALRGETAQAHTLMRRAAFAYPENLDYFYDVIDDHPNDTAIQSLKPDVDAARELFKRAKVI